jgi:hypothetical protein
LFKHAGWKEPVEFMHHWTEGRASPYRESSRSTSATRHTARRKHMPFGLKAVGALVVLFLVGISRPAFAATLMQTVQFEGATPELLYSIFLDAKEHGAACGRGPVEVDPRVGGRIAAFGLSREQCAAWRGCDSVRGPSTLVQATILKLVPGREIVLAWRNLAWRQAVRPSEETDLESIVTLTFTRNAAGAQIELVQVNVPEYLVRMPDDEQGPLSSLVNTHWNLVYWDPWRPYVARRLGPTTKGGGP